MINTPAKIMSVLAALAVIVAIVFAVFTIKDKNEQASTTTTTASTLTRPTKDWQDYYNNLTSTTQSYTYEFSEIETSTTTTTTTTSQTPPVTVIVPTTSKTSRKPSIFEQYKSQIEKDTQNANEAGYYLYRNNNYSYNLITKAKASDGRPVYRFYIYQNGNLVYAKALVLDQARFYTAKDNNGIIVTYELGNTYRMDRIILDNSHNSVTSIVKINKETETTNITDDISEDIVTQEKTFDDYISEYCDTQLREIQVNDTNLLGSMLAFVK